MATREPKTEPDKTALKVLGARVAAGDMEALSEVQGHYRRLVREAEAGDSQAMGKIRALLKHLPGFWTAYDDVMEIALNAHLSATCGDNLMLQESRKRQVTEMSEELAGDDCSPLEYLLAQRIAVCWLQMQYADAIYYQNLQGMQPHWIDSHERRRDRAQRRFLSACKTLATVRKLNVPALQVNIGDQQVNIAGARGGDDEEGA